MRLGALALTYLGGQLGAALPSASYSEVERPANVKLLVTDCFLPCVVRFIGVNTASSLQYCKGVEHIRQRGSLTLKLALDSDCVAPGFGCATGDEIRPESGSKGYRSLRHMCLVEGAVRCISDFLIIKTTLVGTDCGIAAHSAAQHKRE